MTKKIAINGFGRIGRLTTRILLTKFPEIEIVAVNDLTSPENLAYLLSNDSTFRKFNFPVKAEGSEIVINTNTGEKRIKVLSQRDPLLLPWKDMEIDSVIESTGFFTKFEDASKHITAGAKKVIISAPGKGDLPTVVLGVNEIPSEAKVISNASCTTNCISPVLKVLDEYFGIKQTFGLTAHAYTATQPLQDGPTKKDFRDGRAGAVNAIPSTTGAAKAVVEVLPQLAGKVNLMSLRIPVITGSLVYITAQLNKITTVEEINQAFKAEADGNLKGILEYSKEDLVSSDIIANPHSVIVDSQLTEVMGDTVKMVVWYDNEWGYSSRLAELVNIF